MIHWKKLGLSNNDILKNSLTEYKIDRNISRTKLK